MTGSSGAAAGALETAWGELPSGREAGAWAHAASTTDASQRHPKRVGLIAAVVNVPYPR